MRRTGRARVAILAMVALAAPALLADSAVAAGPSITVTPSSGLSDGQTVVVNGTGYDPTLNDGNVQVIECATSPAEVCDFTLGHFGPVPVQPDGSFSTSFTVHQTFQGGASEGGPTTFVDCTVAPGCAIAAYQSTSFGAAQPISFGTPPPPPPSNASMTVTPSTGLTDGQAVTVSGTGYDPTRNGGNVSIIECANAPTTLCDFASAGFAPVQPDGSFSTPFTVHQTFQGSASPGGETTLVDCTVAPGCVIAAGQGFDLFAFQSISFRSAPAIADDCEKGGWETLTDDTGRPFKNQGDCVSFVATGGKNKAAG